MASTIRLAPSPPAYKDIGKATNDLLNKDYPLSKSEIEVTTRAPNNAAFKTKIVQDTAKNVIAGEIEGKFVDPKNGLVFTQTWLTNNSLKSVLELEGQLTKGLKLELTGLLNPDKGSKGAQVLATYKQPAFHGRIFADVLTGPTVTADAVLAHEGFLLGLDSTFDAQKQTLKSYAAALAYATPEYSVTFRALAGLSKYQAGYYHRVNRDTEAAAIATYDTKDSSNVGLEVGTKTYLDGAAFIKAKVNNSGFLTLGYTQALRPGVKFNGGLQIDTMKLSSKSNAEKPIEAGDIAKVGVAFTFEA